MEPFICDLLFCPQETINMQVCIPNKGFYKSVPSLKCTYSWLSGPHSYKSILHLKQELRIEQFGRVINKTPSSYLFNATKMATTFMLQVHEKRGEERQWGCEVFQEHSHKMREAGPMVQWQRIYTTYSSFTSNPIIKDCQQSKLLHQSSIT